jgi:hypothetical protein
VKGFGWRPLAIAGDNGEVAPRSLSSPIDEGLDGVCENPSPAASRMSDRPRAALSRAVCCESKNA